MLRAVARLDRVAETARALRARGTILSADVTPRRLRGSYDYRWVASAPTPALLGPGLPIGQLVDPGSPERRQAASLSIPFDLVERHVAVVAPWWRRAATFARWADAALDAGYRVVTIDRFGWQRHLASGALDVLDPSDAASASFDWVAEAISDGAIDAITDALVGRPGRGRVTQAHDRTILRAILELVRSGAIEPSVRAMHTVLSDPDLLRRAVSAGGRTVGADRLHALARSTPARRRAATETLVGTLAPFLRNGAAASIGSTRSAGGRGSSPAGSIDLDEVLSSPGHLVVETRTAAGRATAAVLLGLLVERAERSRNRVGPGVLVLVPGSRRLFGRLDFAGTLEIARAGSISYGLGLGDVADLLDEHDRARLLDRVGTVIVHGGSSPISARTLSDRVGGKTLGAREIGAPPFVGQVAVVHSPGAHPDPLIVRTDSAPVGSAPESGTFPRNSSGSSGSGDYRASVPNGRS